MVTLVELLEEPLGVHLVVEYLLSVKPGSEIKKIKMFLQKSVIKLTDKKQSSCIRDEE